MLVFKHICPKPITMQEPAELNISKESEKSKLFTGRRYVFDDFEFYPAQQRLLYKKVQCKLEPKMLQLLSLLIEARPNVLSKQELMLKLWPEAIVSDWSLARLVSDTRKLLEDDGKSQSIIKTIRGQGFAFNAQVDEIIDAYQNINAFEGSKTKAQPSNKYFDPERELNTKLKVGNSKSIWLWSSLAIGIFTLMLLVFLNQNQEVARSKTSAIVNHQSIAHKIKMMQAIQKNLVLTKTAFLSQLRRRNELGQLLQANNPELKDLSWEQKFRKYYPSLNKDEKFLFDQIKSITDGPLYQGNQEILTILREHPELFQEIKLFLALNSHLEIWVNKYKNVYSKREDLPIVYVGVEDGVPFPSDIDAEVGEWLKQHVKQERKK